MICSFAMATPLTGQILDHENRRPKIIGQVDLKTNEEEAITLQLSHLYVEDKDDFFYPWGFTLKVFQGQNYILSGNTVTPIINFTGKLSVPVVVNDGEDDSEIYKVEIEVNGINDPPVITGQGTLTTETNTPIALQFSNLVVNDPDNTYPNGFSMSIFAGANYTVNDRTVTPAPNFKGTLSVGVVVNDGVATSPVFNVQISVMNSNKTPVITGQLSLSTAQNQPFIIQFSHITVSDPDNTYPNGFTLTAYNGQNYSVNNTTVTPANNFTGTLSVKITVNDGNTDSAPFDLKINVNAYNNIPTITGQTPVVAREDETIPILTSYLTVADTDDTYPTGFRLVLSSGANYTFFNNAVKPVDNFNGVLPVTVSVVDPKGNASKTFPLMVSVTPINDPPQITKLETSPLLFELNKGPLALSKELDITDVDSDSIFIAQIAFQTEGYRPGNDELLFKNTVNIRGVFDPQLGVMALIGKASLAEYRDAIRALQYNYNNLVNPLLETKVVSISLNDGIDSSTPSQRMIRLGETIVTLDIPSGFTPNGDQANDTWIIKSLRADEQFGKALIRIYNKDGKMVHEAIGIDKAWDGRSNGDLLPADTYFYTIDLNVAYTRASFKGVVTILR